MSIYKNEVVMKFNLPTNIYAYSNATNVDTLLAKKEMQVGLVERHFAEIEAGGYVILDFGVETRGGIRILNYRCKGGTGAIVRIRFGESVAECCSDIGEKNATNDHATRDFEFFLPQYSDQTVGGTGFRFVRIDVLSGKAQLKNVYAASEILSKKPIYAYEGNDALIKEIFEVAKRTVDLCSYGNKVWDGIKRDRLIWIGDMHPETIALATLYGRIGCVEHSLDLAKKEAPLPNWMNKKPSYSMWWVIILADYYEMTGCDDYLRKQSSYLEGLTKQFISHVDENGESDYQDYFADWPTYKTPAAVEGVRAINILAAKKASKLLSILGKDTSEADELYNKLMKKEIVTYGRKQVIGLKHYATGNISDEEKAMLVEGGARGMSTFMSYYILSAIASFDKERAIEIMKEYYGGMLSRGATSFWEDFDVDWLEGSGRIDELPSENEKDIHGDYGAFCYEGFRHSLCHGWSAGVIAFIKENT